LVGVLAVERPLQRLPVDFTPGFAMARDGPDPGVREDFRVVPGGLFGLGIEPEAALRIGGAGTSQDRRISRFSARQRNFNGSQVVFDPGAARPAAGGRVHERR